MATKYILDPSGDIKDITKTTKIQIETDAFLTINSAKDTLSLNDITDLSKELAKSNPNQNADVNVGDDFAAGLLSDDYSFREDIKRLIVNQRDNDSSFGFVGDNTGNRDSFVPMYHFSDDNERYFATEFEMLTGYRGTFVGFDENEETIDFGGFFFVFQYFIEIVALLGIMEGIALINSAITQLSSNNTSTVEKFDLRMGKYSIVEYDIFSMYLFSVLNYPKSDSTFLTRIVSFFVGFASWFSTDQGILYERIIEVASRNKNGSRADENLLDLIGVKDENFLIIVGAAANIGIAALEIALTDVLTSSSNKRLSMLLRKFRQERAWRDNLYKAKKEERSKFLVEFDYYYVRFAIERMHVGLKIVNRYAHEKTYLNPAKPESPLTRVSANRTLNKTDESILHYNDTNQSLQTKNYQWRYKDSDAKSYKPGMTTRLRTLPQALNLSKDFRSHIVFNQSNTVTLDKSIMQNFYRQNKREERRIDKALVKKIEDHLEAEYVPFYMHDLRTNEILSFHAFIESISDSFTPEYNSASGFGRIDDVRSYVKTTRNINISFTVASTSETDHDMMWYQINKLVTMVYPQWSEGLSTESKDRKQKFTFPFTQVPTASPLIRIRLGDVLKNNYSRSSLSRIFGLDTSTADTTYDSNIVSKDPSDGHAFLDTTKSDTQFELLPGLYKIKSMLNSKNQYFEVKNPIVVEKSEYKKIAGFFGDAESEIDISEVNEVVKITGKDIELIVDSSRLREFDKRLDNEFKADSHGQSNYQNLSYEINQKSIANNEIMKPFKGQQNNVSNNPITNSYESGMSRGVAGFITQLDINYNESNWETSRIGSKAPMLVKVTLNFAPIHDITPGIDHNGMMRAPVYNVGRVNNQFFGDSHDDHRGIGSGIAEVIKKYS